MVLTTPNDAKSAYAKGRLRQRGLNFLVRVGGLRTISPDLNRRHSIDSNLSYLSTTKQRIASNNPRALFSVSSYSVTGSESATNPAPACTDTV